MSDAHRIAGGDNNKKGNRYEDAFAVYRIIELSPRVIQENIPVTVREQARCPVDDFVFREIDRHHYYQLKNDLKITWGEDDHKLKREYLAQKSECDARNEDHTLTVVVSHAHRKESLDGAMPTELKGAVRVLHFPEVRRPSELAGRAELREPLAQISASRSPGGELLRGLVEGFHLAWVECGRTEDGSCALAEIIGFLRERPWHRVRRELRVPIHEHWAACEEILNAIPGMTFAIDRGYLEWFLQPRESGMYPHPCDSDEFRRWVERVVRTKPTTFETFEELL